MLKFRSRNSTATYQCETISRELPKHIPVAKNLRVIISLSPGKIAFQDHVSFFNFISAIEMLSEMIRLFCFIHNIKLSILFVFRLQLWITIDLKSHKLSTHSTKVYFIK